MSGLLLRLVILFLLAGGSGALSIALGGREAWFVFGCCLFLAGMGVAAAISVVGEVRVSREWSDTRMVSGGTLVVRGTARLPFRFPFAYAVIRDIWLHEQSGRYVSGAALLIPYGHKEIPFSYSIPRLMRGVYRHVQTETAVFDLLHVSGYRNKRPAAAQANTEIMVYPRSRRAETNHALKIKQPDLLALGGVRQYAEGDSVRRIDWKTYARSGKLMTRLPDEEAGKRVCIVIDAGASEQQFERNVETAAGWLERLAAEVNESGLEAGIVSSEGTVIESEGSGYPALYMRLSTLKWRTESHLDPLMAAADSAVGDRGELVLITGSLNDDVHRLAARGKRGERMTIAYASSKPVLSVHERNAASVLLRLGCRFVFIPDRTGTHEGVRAHG